MLSEKDRLEFSLARSFGEKRKERIERKERVFATVFLSSTAKFAQTGGWGGKGGRLCRDIVISFRVIWLEQSRRSDGNIDARRRNYIVKRMQSYVGRDPNAAAGQQEVECPRTTYGLALGTNVIVCLVNISWSAEKRDDTCSKTVSVLLLPANDGAAMGKRTLADLFRCKF